MISNIVQCFTTILHTVSLNKATQKAFPNTFGIYSSIAPNADSEGDSKGVLGEVQDTWYHFSTVTPLVSVTQLLLLP